jgi:electron transfer flavoprotein alpha subunit
MSVLIIAEPTTGAVKPATLTTVGAAARLEGDLHVLVIGADCAGAAEAAARIAGVSRILVADGPQYQHPLAENVAPLIAGLAKGYSHVLAPATTFGKNVMPRVAALLDVAQLSEIVAVESADTFQRSIYAGNAITTVQSPDPIKVITVRGTAFEAAEGGSAVIEPVPAAPEAGVSRFVGEELSKSERPELTSARVIVSGGRGMQSGENLPCWTSWLIGWGRRSVLRAPRSMPGSCLTIIRSG